jgi:hypothetical protein
VIRTFRAVMGLARDDTLVASGGVANNGGTMEAQVHRTPGRRLARPKQRAPRMRDPSQLNPVSTARQSFETPTTNWKLSMTLPRVRSGGQVLPVTDQRVGSPLWPRGGDR